MVLSELTHVVGGNHVHSACIGQQLDNRIGQDCGLLAPGMFPHQLESRGPFHEGHNGPSPPPAHHSVYLPIPEPAGLGHHPGTFLNRHPMTLSTSHRPQTMFEPAKQLLVQAPCFVPPDALAYLLIAHHRAFHPQRIPRFVRANTIPVAATVPLPPARMP